MQIDHGLKSAYLGLGIADALRLPAAEREAVYYGALVKDVGCTACAAGVSVFFPDDELAPRADMMLMDITRPADVLHWLGNSVTVDRRLPSRVAGLLSFAVQCQPLLKETARGHCEVAELFARRLGFPEYVQRALRFQFERWDGRGIGFGVKGEAIPPAARVLHLAQMVALAYQFGGRQAAIAQARERRGQRFDPQMVDTFLALAKRRGLWQVLELEEAEAVVLPMAPPTAVTLDAAEQVSAVCEAVADLTDYKSRHLGQHSRWVAEVAEGIGRRLGLGATERVRLRHAALVHDAGKAAVPFGVLSKRGRLAGVEREQFRLHPYYTQRVLERVRPLQHLALEAAAHHEWVNGEGYHRQLSGGQIPLNGRILAVADAYAESAGGEAALRHLAPLAGRQFDGDCYDALVASVTGAAPPARAPATGRVGELTERETEVLRLLARGLKTAQIAQTLVLSKRTVEHHLERIYGKLDVTSATAAVVYAFQQGIG
jgi:HD-GYP domain-containing protein (c-di-GMP phosphodiesterase class II)